MKTVYIVLRLLVNEHGSCCENTKTVLGAFEDYDKALECAKLNTIGETDLSGEDESPGELVTSIRQTINLQPPPYSCNICKDPISGIRELINPGKAFEMKPNDFWTCGYLQETVQDVPSDGTAEEARFCAIAQAIAAPNCDCIGPPAPEDIIIDPNPKCNLCANQRYNFVPDVNKKKLTNTKLFGRHNCEGLYIAAAEGVFNVQACSILQQNSGSDCCNLIIDPNTKP